MCLGRAVVSTWQLLGSAQIGSSLAGGLACFKRGYLSGEQLPCVITRLIRHPQLSKMDIDSLALETWFTFHGQSAIFRVAAHTLEGIQSSKGKP